MGEKLKHEIKEIVEIESRLRRGKDYEIIIPNKVFERLNKIYKTDIFKLLIENDVNKVHYWKYNPHREHQISSKEFKEGKYRISIEPYNVLKFIREFNEKVRGKLKVELSLEQNKIALKIRETTLFSKEWSFDKEHGGGISIKASFPSITRAERKIILKFQLKNEEAKIWIVEPRKSGFRPAIYLIERLFSKYGSIVAVYRHGKRQKITLITFEVKLDYKDAVEKTFEYLSITETRQVRIGDKQLLSYSYNITSEDTSDMLDYLMRLSYMLIKTQEYSTLGREIRDKIGKYITAMFLSKIGLKEIYVDPLSTPKFRFLSSIL